MPSRFMVGWMMLLNAAYIFRRLLHLEKPTKKRTAIIFAATLVLSIFAYLMNHVLYFSISIWQTAGLTALLYFLYRRDLNTTFLSVVFSLGFVYALYIPAVIVINTVQYFLDMHETWHYYLLSLVVGAVMYLFARLIFRIPRLRNGIPYLMNNQADIFGDFIALSLLVILTIQQLDVSDMTIAVSLIIMILLGVMIVIWMQMRTKREYVNRIREREIQRLSAELERQNTEIERLSSLLHRDNKLLAAMTLAVDEVLANVGKLEAGDHPSKTVSPADADGFSNADSMTSVELSSNADSMTVTAASSNADRMTVRAASSNADSMSVRELSSNAGSMTVREVSSKAVSAAAADGSSKAESVTVKDGSLNAGSMNSAEVSSDTDRTAALQDAGGPTEADVPADGSDLAARALVLREELRVLSEERLGTIRSYELETQPLPKSGIPAVDMQLTYMQKRAAAEGILLAFSEDGSLPRFVPRVLTETELVTILADLLENAIHATAAAGGDRIFLFIGLRDGVFGIEVSDTGVPFPESVAAAYGKGRFTTRADEGGTGIGLETIHDILKKHGGSFRVVTLPEDAPYRKTIRVCLDGGNTWGQEKLSSD